MHALNATHNGTLEGPGPNDPPRDGPTSFPTSSFPAWAPSVAVALAMLTFLAASFYIRHRKVVKKRELLMDYFYIIFQYGGLRRKRMVAALCNTNAITLRELGRSFMISFDSVNNPENSCPFFLEDNSAFDGSHNVAAGHSAHKKTFFNRAMLNSRKYRLPFRRHATQLSDEGQTTYPVSFHDILMKFKSKRPPPAPPGTPCMRSRSPTQCEMQGSSMCTIHGDDFDYQKYMEENEINSPVFYRRMRRNAYVPQPSPKLSSRFADLVTEAKRHSLGNVFHEHVLNEGKRNSEPFEYQGEGRVFQVYGDHLTPPGASPASQHLREPTILVHSASSDWSNDGNGWTELPGPSGEGGVVFVRRLSRVDTQPGEYTYCHEPASQVGLAKRANLSKVNVQSGNTSEYYNCLQRDPTMCQTPDKSPVNTSGENTPTRETGPGAMLGKRGRGRLSLGEIAVSNLNRRIDLTSESLREYYPEVSDRSKNRWARFKHVFSGSRPSSSKSSSIPSNQSSGRGKSLVSSIVEERVKKREYQHNRTRWQKFVNVFTGFRSLPEQNSTHAQMNVPTGSRSYPAGLNMKRSEFTCERSESLDLPAYDVESGPLREEIDHSAEPSAREPESSPRSQPYRNIAAMSPREDFASNRSGTRRFRSVFLAYKATRPTGSKRYRKKYDSVTNSCHTSPYHSNLNVRSSLSQRVNQSSPLAREDSTHCTGATNLNNKPVSDEDLQSEASGLCSDPRHDYSPRHNRSADHIHNSFHRPIGFTSPSHNAPFPRDQAVPGYYSGPSKSSEARSGRTLQLNSVSSSGSDGSTDQPQRFLLPEKDTMSIRPHATQTLLSPDTWKVGNSSESVYYDTFSSPFSSPLPARSFPQKRTSTLARSPIQSDSRSPKQQTLTPERARHPLGSSDQRLEAQRNSHGSLDWRFFRRRSEELRPEKRSTKSVPRRRSAISNASSIGSSLLTSTEVILVPMTISAPDSPVAQQPTSPSHPASKIVQDTRNRLAPSHCTRHAPVRLTVSCPSRSESDTTITMTDEGENSVRCSQDLRRNSNEAVSHLASSSPLLPPAHLGRCPPSPGSPRPSVGQAPGRRGEGGRGRDCATTESSPAGQTGARQARLLRQSSQDVKPTGQCAPPSSNWGK